MYTIDHIGIAVTDLNSAIDKHKNDFGLDVSLREKIISQQVEIAFLETPGSKIELLQPLEGNVNLQKFLQKHGPGLHHICYRVTDIKAELARFAAAGYQLVDHEPRPGANNSLIAFIHPKSMGGVLTELCQHV